MRTIFLSFIFCVGFTSGIIAQEVIATRQSHGVLPFNEAPRTTLNIPENFELLVVFEAPLDLKHGYPSEILIDEDHNLFVLSYDYKPTYLDFYQMDTWTYMGRADVKGFATLDNSYVEDGELFVDYGFSKPKFFKIDLETFEKEKVKCEDAPRGCESKKIILSADTFFDDPYMMMIDSDWYIIRYNGEETEIYLKKS